MISKETLLSACKKRIEKVEVPLEGGHVFVKSMTAQERDDYEITAMEIGAKTFSRAMMVIFSACDKDGNLIFSSDDIEAVKNMDASIVQPIFNKALDLSYFTAEDIEELEKN